MRRYLLVSALCLPAAAVSGGPLVFHVNSTADAHDANGGDAKCETSTPGVCTLRAAVEQANASGGAGIVVPAGSYTLSLGEILVTGTDVISGAGLKSTVITAGAGSRLFSVSAGGASLELDDLTLKGGSLSTGAGGGVSVTFLASLTMKRSLVMSCSAPSGGGIFAAGPLTLEDAAVDDCHATAGAGGAIVFNASADGFASASLTRVTLSHGSATGAGGAIFFPNGYGFIGLVNTTVSGNHAGGDGGGLRIEGGTVVFDYATIADNSTNVSSGGGGLSSTAAAAATALYRVIVSGNFAPFGQLLVESDCDGALTSGNSLFSPDGIFGCSITGTYTAVDPLLGFLKDNGGYGATHALLSGSPAIDADGCQTRGTAVTNDQRGVKRPIGGAGKCDIGAYERSPCGDVNGDGTIDVLDAFFLINYLFAAGSVPPGLANLNGDSATDVSDVFFLINRLFASGPAPSCPGT